MQEIEKYGFDNSIFEKEETQGYIPARVTAVHRERYQIISEKGIGYAKLKSAVYYNDLEEVFPTVGDFVLIQHNDGGDSLIVKTGERKSCFRRKDPQSGAQIEQLVAANFDYVFIMSSLNHDLNYKRLDRYLVLSWQSGAIPVILLTKADLAQNSEQILWETQNMAAGVDVIAISVKTGEGVEAMQKYLEPGKTVVFLGSSGVGKSSLVNFLEGESVMVVKEIRDDDSKGRHTTTHRQLFMLKSGAMVIDTPGMRELGMWDAAQGVGQTFSDIEEYASRCKFRNCTHESEPGCAVQKALADKELSEQRWQSYKKLKKENMYIDAKAQAIKQKEAKMKAISKYSKSLKKNKETW